MAWGPGGRPAVCGPHTSHPTYPTTRGMRRLTWIAAFGAAMIVAFPSACLGYEVGLPSVADAGARVAAIVREHHGQMGGLPLPAKLAAAVVATEDEHFYSNVVVDVLAGMGRAALATLRAVVTPAAARSPSSSPSDSTARGAASGPRWRRSASV